MEVYGVFQTRIGKVMGAADWDGLIICGEPEWFTSKTEAINYAQDKARGLTTRFYSIWSYAADTGACYVGSAGFRPATYRIDFPGSFDYCVGMNERVGQLAAAYRDQVMTAEGV